MRRTPLPPMAWFLLIGLGLYLGVRLIEGPPPLLRIELSQTILSELRAARQRETGAVLGREELAAEVRGWVEEELLFREALTRGLHRHDAVVRQRLIRNMRFLAESEAGNERDLFRDALALGLEQGDVVIRRRLVERMRALAVAAVEQGEPSAAELEASYAQDTERFRLPTRVRLSHVFLDPARHGQDLETRARHLRTQLVEAGLGPLEGVKHGDAFLLGHHLPPHSAARLAGRFGDAFARVALASPPNGWSAPVRSGYGVHLVWVHERIPGERPPLAHVRAAVREAWRAAQRESALREFLNDLRVRYVVEVAEELATLEP